MVAEGNIDELTFEPVAQPELEPTMGLSLESIRRRVPTMEIQ